MRPLGLRIPLAAVGVALLGLVPAAGAHAVVTESRITVPSADPLYAVTDEDAPGPQTVCVEGTTDSSEPSSDHVDIACFDLGGAYSYLYLGAPLGPDGSFSVDVPATYLGSQLCKLRAVPASYVSGDASAFAGPVVVAALGFGTPRLAYPAAVSLVVGQPLDLRPVTFERTGASSFSVSPPLPAGLSLDPATGRITGTPLAPQPRTAYTVTARDLVGAAAAEISLAVAGGEPEPGGGGREEPGGGPGSGPGAGAGADGVAAAAAPGGSPPRRAAAPPLSIGRVAFRPRALTMDAAGKARRIHLVLRLSRPAAVRLRVKGRGTVLSFALGRRPAGRSIVNLRAKLAHRALAPGRCRVVVSATRGRRIGAPDRRHPGPGGRSSGG